MRRGDGGARTGTRKRMEEEGMGLGFQIRAGAASIIYAPAAGPTPGDPFAKSGSPITPPLAAPKQRQTPPDPYPAPARSGCLAPGACPAAR